MVRPQVNSRKHIRQITQTQPGMAAILTTDIVLVAQTPDNTNAVQVEPGTNVKAVYVEMWLNGTDQQNSTQVTTVEKLESGVSSMSFANSVNLHQYNNKKNILYTTMGLVGDANANPIPVLRQWVPIPKGKQRFGLGDRLVLNVSAITNDVEMCGHFTYKSYN